MFPLLEILSCLLKTEPLILINFGPDLSISFNSENFSNAYKFMERKDYEKLFKSYEINEERPQTSIKNVNYVFTFNNSNN